MLAQGVRLVKTHTVGALTFFKNDVKAIYS